MSSRESLVKIVLVLVLAAAQPLFSLAGKFPYEPIADIELSAYLGRWFQSYASNSVIWTFELGGNCVTADYFATDKDRTVRVLNTVRPFGDFDGHAGFFSDVLQYCLALPVNGFLSLSSNVDGQGSVTLQPGPIPFGIGTPDIEDVFYTDPGNYWVIELGPKEDGQYRYAVVTNAVQTQLYILVRDVKEFEERFEQKVLKRINSFGFVTPTNKPLKTNQEGCGYKGQNHMSGDNDARPSKSKDHDSGDGHDDDN